MPKASLRFDLSEPEEFQAFRKATNAELAYLCLWEIAQDLFRPARKHGYPDARMQQFGDLSERETAIIGVLEKMFYEILEERGVNIDE